MKLLLALHCGTNRFSQRRFAGGRVDYWTPIRRSYLYLLRQEAGKGIPSLCPATWVRVIIYGEDNKYIAVVGS